jgi:hypothetical protein
MADDDAAIIVVMMMACFFSAVMSAGLSYTCTGGSFDPDDFDTDKCLELFPEDTSGGGGGGTTTPTQDPSTYAPADEYAFCKGQFYNDATTTCFSSGGIAGIRWSWLENDEASTCRQKTYKYGIVVSSSQNSHRVKYRFPDIIGSDANSFNFSGAPSGFLPGQNIRFYITPLDVNDKKVGDTAEYVLDVDNSSETCRGHGSPVSFSKATIIEDPNASDPSAAPPPDPVPCEGSVYKPVSGCMRAGLELNDPYDSSRCGDGFQTTELDTSHASYKAPEHGGTCEYSKTVPCSNPCSDTVVREKKTQADCNLEAYTYNQWTNSLGCVKDTGFDKTSPPTDARGYVQITENCFPIGEKDGVVATLSMKPSVDEYSCVPVYNWNACGKTECPKNCVGDWVDHPTPEERCCMRGGTIDRCADRSGDEPSVGREGPDGRYGIGLKKGKRQKFVVSPGYEANSTGSCPKLNKERWYLWKDSGCSRPPHAGGAFR